MRHAVGATPHFWIKTFIIDADVSLAIGI